MTTAARWFFTFGAVHCLSWLTMAICFALVLNTTDFKRERRYVSVTLWAAFVMVLSFSAMLLAACSWVWTV